MRLLPAVALILFLGLVGAAPALADDIPPPVFPSGLPGPDDVPGGGPVKSSPGPTYVVDPGSSGTTLPAPRATTTTAPGRTPATKVGKAQVDDARRALNRASQRPATQVAAPVATSTAPVEDGTDWWLIGSGGFLMLLLVEARRVTGRMLHDA